MIEALFPPEVIVVRATEAMQDLPLHPEEAARTDKMAPKRLHEYKLGRACVREGLARLGIADFPFVNDTDRSPIWPPEIVGSLTHCRDLCAVALARRGAIQSVGLDAEPLRGLAPAVLERITSASEREWLENLPQPTHIGGWGLLLFSAKEAFYKSYYPLTRTFLGFRDAELEIDVAGKCFIARLAKADSPSAAGRREFEGRFEVGECHLVSAVTLRC